MIRYECIDIEPDIHEEAKKLHASSYQRGNEKNCRRRNPLFLRRLLDEPNFEMNKSIIDKRATSLDSLDSLTWAKYWVIKLTR